MLLRRQSNICRNDYSAARESELRAELLEEGKAFEPANQETAAVDVRPGDQAASGLTPAQNEADRKPKKSDNERKNASGKMLNLLSIIAMIVSLPTGILGLIDPVMMLVRDNRGVEAGQRKFKSLAMTKFNDHLESAEAALVNDNAEGAKAHYSEALSLGGIPSEETARAMIGLAKLLIEERRFDEAGPLAQIAASRHRNKSAYANPYASILIEKCNILDALVVLESLEKNKGKKSEQLIELAKSRSVSCAK